MAGLDSECREPALPETEAVDALAETIAAARLARTPLPAQAGKAPPDVAGAYAVQSAVHRRLAASRFGRRSGWKIGCTTPVMQDYLGIDHPCAAGLFGGSTHASGAVLRHADFVRVGVECEIAVRLAHDLAEEGATAESVRGAVGAVMAAIEIVDDRYVDWQTIGTPMLIADDFFARLLPFPNVVTTGHPAFDPAAALRAIADVIIDYGRRCIAGAPQLRPVPG